MSTVYRYGVWFIKGLREYTKSGYEVASKSFESLDGIDVSGRSFMITGANSGVGKEAALEIAKHGGTVHMVCRNKERGEKALEEIKSSSNNDNVHLHLLDISNPKLVYDFTDQFKTSGESLDVLVNNAGCMVNERKLNEHNLEINFCTNTLGAYILTENLMEVLQKGKNPQVITVTSGGMLLLKLDSKDLQSEKMDPFDGAMVYSQNKRQQIVLTDWWAKTCPNVQFTTMHPGWSDTPAVRSSMPDFHRRMGDKLRTPYQGADTLIWLCLSPTARKEKSGGFYQDRRSVSKHLPFAWTSNSDGEVKEFIDKLRDITSKIKK